ncbi:unnamed protein product [Coregonus sp. 'balchen']|nr:unnamed protein product [Coregonus sp. 'balchen']
MNIRRLVGVGVVRPSLTVLLPSSEEQDKGNVALVCLANRGFPGGWKLGWRLGAGGALQGSQSLEVLEKDGHYSWSSSLTLPTDQWRNAGSVTCEATLKDQTPVTHTLEPRHCSHEEQDQGNVALVCLANRGFPGGWKLGWRLGAGGALQGSQSLEVLEKDGHYSWSSSLTLPTDQWRNAGSVTCEATLKDQTPVTHTLEPRHCSQ